MGFLLFLLQSPSPAAGATTGNEFTITEMVKNMGAVAITVVIILLIMSVYSIAIMVERYLTYTAAKKQSREFAPRVAQALKNNRIEEAINISDKHRKSHLAMVVNSGLQEFRAHEQSSDISGDEIEASKRALQRAIAIKTAEFRRGLSAVLMAIALCSARFEASKRALQRAIAIKTAERPRRNSAVLMAIALCSARFEASISSPEMSDDCSCARNSCSPLFTTMARCDLRCLSLILIASSIRLFLSA